MLKMTKLNFFFFFFGGGATFWRDLSCGFIAYDELITDSIFSCLTFEGRTTRQRNSDGACNMTWMTSLRWKTGDQQHPLVSRWDFQPTTIQRWRHAVTWLPAMSGSRSITITTHITSVYSFAVVIVRRHTSTKSGSSTVLDAEFTQLFLCGPPP